MKPATRAFAAWLIVLSVGCSSLKAYPTDPHGNLAVRTQVDSDVSAELHLQRHYQGGGIIIPGKEPEGGLYMLVADATPIDRNRTRIIAQPRETRPDQPLEC